MTCTSDIFLPPSGDWASTVPLFTDDGNGPPADLTGWTASIVDVTGVLVGAVSASIPTPASGAVRLAIVWQGGWPLLPALLGTFRLSLVSGGQEIVTTPTLVYVAGRGIDLAINRGSDATIPFTWPDDRGGASLAGEAVDVVNASATLAPLATVEVLDAATRACRLHIEGDIAVALGGAGSFQMRRTIGGGQPRTLPPVAVTFR